MDYGESSHTGHRGAEKWEVEGLRNRIVEQEKLIMVLTVHTVRSF